MKYMIEFIRQWLRCKGFPDYKNSLDSSFTLITLVDKSKLPLPILKFLLSS